ncbi:propanediol utilization protein [Algicella marina]|uniref:Propanediol utilization protein n=1 Tax=Algicella marina TaxID=2683284 RepID=A0A6P1SW25_9RHOB|nr:propanediol utilization protein [Algicella marina]QHQ33967.1 propanediol utilization protein [Algicella marina]
MPDRGWRKATRTGHFGEFLQGRLGPDGPVALITLPCSASSVTAAWRPGGPFFCHAPGLRFPPETYRTLFRAVLGTVPNGRLVLRSSLPAGHGCGVSTASLLAVLQVLGEDITAASTALTLAVEGATDPLMLAEPSRHLWASRRGESLALMPSPPVFDIVGGFLGPSQRTRAEDSTFADISDLATAWPAAAGAGDRAALAALATASATRNRALRGGPDLAPLLAATDDLGALGLACAHTGSAVALLFAPDGIPATARPRLRALGLTGIRSFRSGGTP